MSIDEDRPELNGLSDDPDVRDAVKRFVEEFSGGRTKQHSSNTLNSLLDIIDKKIAEATDKQIKGILKKFSYWFAVSSTAFAAALGLAAYVSFDKITTAAVAGRLYPPESIFEGILAKADPPQTDDAPNKLSPWIRREIYPALIEGSADKKNVALLMKEIEDVSGDQLAKSLSLDGRPTQVTNTFRKEWQGKRFEAALSRIVSNTDTNCGYAIDHKKKQAILALPPQSEKEGFLPYLRCGTGWPTIDLKVKSDRSSSWIEDIQLVGFVVADQQRYKRCTDGNPSNQLPDCTYGELQLTNAALNEAMERDAGSFSGRVPGLVEVQTVRERDVLQQ